MYINQAYKGKNEWWRFLLTSFLVTGIFIANFMMYFFVSKEQISEAYESMAKLPKAQVLITNLLPFVFLLGLLFYLVLFLHKRNILSLSTSRKRIDFNRIVYSFGLIFFLNISCFVVSYFIDSSTIIWNFKPVQFVILFVISILLFPFQIAFEEYLFRGYLMQQIGVMAKNRWFPLVFTSIVFGLFHTLNPEVEKMGYGVMVFYIGTGLLLGIMTLMDEGIELALGFHLGNNLISALLITSDFSAIQTDAVFKYSSEIDTVNILSEMIVSMLMVYPIILFIFAKKYNWNQWKAKIFGKIKSQSYLGLAFLLCINN
jgi:membrane protease YdiL (CAAX protease family)